MKIKANKVYCRDVVCTSGLTGVYCLRAIYTSESNKGFNLKSSDGDGFIGCGSGGG